MNGTWSENLVMQEGAHTVLSGCEEFWERKKGTEQGRGEGTQR